MDDKIELPPLPRADFSYSTEAMERYARAAVLADRERRAEQAQPAKPKVHSSWIELFPDGSWTISHGLASHHSTSTMLHICWTDDGRAWIESERNRELAARLRYYASTLRPDGFRWHDFADAADALDGGVR